MNNDTLAGPQTKEKRVRHDKKPDAQGFDEIRLVTKPRFKTSGLSGDEWRISVSVQFWRKGKMVKEDFCGHDMEAAARRFGSEYGKAHDEGLMFFGGGENGTCDQEGCVEQATVFYRKKFDHCNEPYHHKPIPLEDEIVVRQFCERHSKRGDSSFDDSDQNYELIDGSIVPPRKEDVRPAVFGGVVDGTNL